MSKKNQQIKVGGKNTGKITQSEPEAELTVDSVEKTAEGLALDPGLAPELAAAIGVTEEEAQEVLDKIETQERSALGRLENRIENKAFTSYEVKSREIKLEIEGHNPHYVSREIGLSTNLDNG